MLGINKLTVSDRFDERGNKAYVVEVDYYFETGKNELGLPATDLSKVTQLYANFQTSSENILTQNLSFPTFIGTSLNPDIRKLRNGFRYPFSARFNVDSEESLNFVFEFQLFSKDKSSRKEKYYGIKPFLYSKKQTVELFSAGNLKINGPIAIEDKRTDFYDNIFDFDLFEVGGEKNNSTVSDLLISYGKNKTVRGMFFFDKRKFIADNSDFGKILKNANIPKPSVNSIMLGSKINNITITRKRLSDLNDFQNKPYTADKNQIIRSVAIGFEEKGAITATKGNLEQLQDLDLSDFEYEKIIAFNDSDLRDVNKHQYSLSMRVEDGILKWLIDSMNVLIRSQKDLKAGGSRINRATIMRVVRILFTLNENLDITQSSLSDYLRNMTTQEGSKLLLSSYITDLINKLSNLIGNSGLISQTNSEYSKVYSKNNSELFFLDLKINFSTIADFSDATDLTYDYLGFEESSDIGATIVSREQMQERADSEFQKLIDSDTSSGFADLSTSIHVDVFNTTPFPNNILGNAYFNFEPNYFSFFSPVRIGEIAITKENAFNFDLLTQEHFKQKYDDNLTPETSVSYYLQEQGASVGQDFFREDPPLKDQSISSTYFPANSVFSNNDDVNEAPTVTQDYKDGLDIEPMKAASKTFANMFLRNEEGWNLSREDFDLTTKQNLISSVTTRSKTLPPTVTATKELDIVRQMPNQIRAIFASTSDKCVNQWLSPSMEGDYIYSPNTYYAIKQNYMNLVKIEYLAGFKNDANGIPDVKNPIFKKLTDLDGTGKIICRASIYNDARFRIGIGFDKISYADEYFILELTE